MDDAAEAIKRHREIVKAELASQQVPPPDALIREIHGDLKVVARVQEDQLQEAVKTNHRISTLEGWRDRMIGGGVLAVAMSPLFIFEVRQWIAGIMGG